MTLSNRKNVLATFALLVVGTLAVGAQAGHTYDPKPEPEDCCEGKTTILMEDFEGYSYDTYTVYKNPSKPWLGTETVYVDFPDREPSWDPVRFGLPQIGEVASGGAKIEWYGAAINNSGTLHNDVGIQRLGGGGNNTHTGRVGGASGAMLFNVSTVGYENVMLSFDYRTFNAESDDRFRVYTFIGDLTADANNIIDLSESDLSTVGWEKILNVTPPVNNFKDFCAELAGGEESIWVMFWMDGNVDDDYAKFDNIIVCGDEVPDETPEIPAPAALPAGLAMLGLALSRRRRNG